jgi:hypothetical protein
MDLIIKQHLEKKKMKNKIYSLPSQWNIDNIDNSFIVKCYKLAYQFSYSKLDCIESWSRKFIDMSLNDYVNNYFMSTYKHSYFGVKCNFPNDNQYLSIGFTYDLKNVTYYLFLDLELKHLIDIVSEYDLKII